MSATWPASVWQRFALTLGGLAGDPWWTVNAVLRVEGDLDPRVLVDAAGDLLARHDLLRSRLDPDAVAQVVEDAVRPDITVSSLGAAPDVRDWLHHPVPPDAPSPLVLRLAVLSPREHLLSAHLHHLFADPSTLWTVLRDLGELYAARLGAVPPDPPTGQYGEYAAYEAESERSNGPRAARWWHDALDGVRFASPPPTGGEPFALRRPVLSAEEVEHLRTWARERLGTPFAAVLAVLAEEMAGHVTGGDHLLFATLFLRRDQPRWRTLAGPCITPSYAAVPLDATSDLRRLVLHLGGAERWSRHPVWELGRVTDTLADPTAFMPFIELIPQLRPEAIPFGPARAVVEAAAGPRDTGRATELGIRLRTTADGALVAHLSGDGRGWDERTVHAVLDGLPDRVRNLVPRRARPAGRPR